VQTCHKWNSAGKYEHIKTEHFSTQFKTFTTTLYEQISQLYVRIVRHAARGETRRPTCPHFCHRLWRPTQQIFWICLRSSARPFGALHIATWRLPWPGMCRNEAPPNATMRMICATTYPCATPTSVCHAAAGTCSIGMPLSTVSARHSVCDALAPRGGTVRSSRGRLKQILDGCRFGRRRSGTSYVP
jgi:hypothetical protein